MKKVSIILLLLAFILNLPCAQAQRNRANADIHVGIVPITTEIADTAIQQLKREKISLERQEKDSARDAQIKKCDQGIISWTNERLAAEQRQASQPATDSSKPVKRAGAELFFINDLPGYTIKILDSPFKGIILNARDTSETILVPKGVCTIHYEWAKYGSSGQKTIRTWIWNNRTEPIRASDIPAWSER